MSLFRKNESLGLLDFGTSYVKYALMTFDGGRPRILDVKRIPRNRLRKVEPSETLQAIGPALFPPRGIQSVIPSQLWMCLEKPQLKTRFVSHEERRSNSHHPIKASEITDLREAVKKKVVEDVSWRNTHDTTSYFFLGPRIESFYLNGYLVRQPFGMQGGTLRIDMFLAAVDANIILPLQRVFAGFGFRVFRFLASPLLMTQHVAPYLINASGLIIDIGGRSTDIIFVDNGFLRDIITFGKGVDELILRISEELRLPLQEAEQFRHDGSEKILAKELQAQYERIAGEVAFDWARDVLSALSRASSVDFSFHKVLMVGGGATIPHFTEALRTAIESWGNYLLSSPDVSVFNPALLVSPFDPKGLLGSAIDVVLASMVKEVWLTHRQAE